MDWISKHKYGAATQAQKQVRPVFAVLVGLVVLGFTFAIHTTKL